MSLVRLTARNDKLIFWLICSALFVVVVLLQFGTDANKITVSKIRDRATYGGILILIFGCLEALQIIPHLLGSLRQSYMESYLGSI